MTTRSLAAAPTDHAVANDPVREARAEELRWYVGSTLFALFGVSLFDQLALPSVAAGVEATGRIRHAPWARATRTIASEEISFWGDAADREREAERLRTLHRDVRGTAEDGSRYSALRAESWNWVLVSIFLARHRAYTPITGDRLTDADDQAMWDQYLAATAHLQLPGAARLPGTYREVVDYYDRVVESGVAANPALDAAIAAARSFQLPDGLPWVVRLPWCLGAPVAGHLWVTLGLGIVHPGIRDLTDVRWNWVREQEFAVLTRVIRVAHRRLPDRLTHTPLAYNRRQYERTVARYRSLGLTSFTADSTAA